MQTHRYCTIIIDDEPDARGVLRGLIERYCPALEVCAEAGSVADGLAAIQQHRPALVFLDIDMGSGSGFDILKAFPNPDFKIVFVTAYDDYALDAFKVRALHYLLKPIDPLDLIAVTNELDAPAPAQTGAATAPVDVGSGLLLPTIQGTLLVRLEEICYFTTDDKYASMALQDGGKVFVGLTLKELENRLPGDVFIRPHQSYLVRIDCIRKVLTSNGLTLVLKDETAIPVSRRNREMVLRVLGMA